MAVNLVAAEILITYGFRYVEEYPNTRITRAELASLTMREQPHNTLYAAISVILIKKAISADYNSVPTGIKQLCEVFDSGDFRNMPPIEQLKKCQNIVRGRTLNFFSGLQRDDDIEIFYQGILALNSDSINIDELGKFGSIIETFIISNKRKQHTNQQNKMDLQIFKSSISSEIRRCGLQKNVVEVFCLPEEITFTEIPQWLNIYMVSHSISNLLIVDKKLVNDAAQNEWITADEAEKYIDLHKATKKALLRQLFDNGFRLTNDTEVILEEVQERLYAIYYILKSLDDKTFEISEKLDNLLKMRRETFPRKPRYESLDYQSSLFGYGRISTNSSNHRYRSRNKDGTFYTFNEHKLKHYNGWKIHLSVMHADLEKAYELAASVLFQKEWYFKLVNKSHIQTDLLEKVDVLDAFTFFASQQCYGTKQFTIYLEEKEGAPIISVEEIKETLLTIEKLFKENSIAVGTIPISDRLLKYTYFSMRNDQHENGYVSAEEAGDNYNPANCENPYIALLAPSL